MEKIIEIDLNNKYDFIDKYNEKNVSKEMIEYIINKAMQINYNRKMKIVINNKCNIDKDIKKMLKEELKNEYKISLIEYDRTNIKQLLFLALGIFFIYIATKFKQGSLWNEILIITGWFPIWETIELELLVDAEARKRRRFIKKILNSEIIENN